MIHCLCCGLPVSGDVRGSAGMTRRSCYLVHREFPAWLIIVDVGGGLSVTSDAERVIDDLVNELQFDVDSYRIIYRDSEGTWDGLLTTAGKFAGFHLLNARSSAEAKAAWDAERAGQPE